LHKEQEKIFWQIIGSLDELNLLYHVMIIGSWAEYLYSFYFQSDFHHNLLTRDLDLFFININKPNQKIDLIGSFSKFGLIYQEDPFNGVGKFYKENLIEVEFLTRSMGSGFDNHTIKSIGIKSESLRSINIFLRYPCEVKCNGFCLKTPDPSAYILQKLMINKDRFGGKKEKDIRSIKELAQHIIKNKEEFNKLQKIFFSLPKKSQEIIRNTTKSNFIELSLA
jgi:hypothetical protein